MDQQPKEPKPRGLNLNLDTTPILYTDNISMTTNEDGVVLDVCQRVVTSDQWRIVARIGMSRNHAKKFIAEMGKLLLMTEGQGRSGEEKKKEN